MQYDAQLINLKNILPQAKSVLIALPVSSNIDKLASGLALYLSLKSIGKEVSVVCDDTILVGQSHLYAIDKVQKTLPQTGSGDFIITLEGVAANGIVPSLEKEDYFVNGNNLDLVFKVLPGQTFQPSKITPHYQNGSFDVIITIGATSLNNLGSIYAANTQVFSSGHLVNIDNQQVNTNFGATNVVEPNASSLSEMISLVMFNLGLPLIEDISTNLLTGIFDVTDNLTGQKVGADTYEAVALCLKAGGRRPGQFQPQPQPQQPTVSQNSFVQPAPAPGAGWNFGGNAGPTFDLSALMPADPQTQQETITPTMPNAQPVEEAPSPEERPAGEGVVSEAEPDWLTPKIFKGTSLG